MRRLLWPVSALLMINSPLPLWAKPFKTPTQQHDTASLEDTDDRAARAGTTLYNSIGNHDPLPIGDGDVLHGTVSNLGKGESLKDAWSHAAAESAGLKDDSAGETSTQSPTSYDENEIRASVGLPPISGQPGGGSNSSVDTGASGSGGSTSTTTVKPDVQSEINQALVSTEENANNMQSSMQTDSTANSRLSVAVQGFEGASAQIEQQESQQLISQITSAASTVSTQTTNSGTVYLSPIAARSSGHAPSFETGSASKTAAKPSPVIQPTLDSCGNPIGTSGNRAC